MSRYAAQIFSKRPLVRLYGILRPLLLAPLRRKELFETQVHDAPLLFRRDDQFCGAVILQTPLENAEHLGGRLARGADDENVSEALPISAITFRQPFHD